MSIDGQDGRFLEIVGTTRECPNTTQRPLTTGWQILGYVYCSTIKEQFLRLYCYMHLACAE